MQPQQLYITAGTLSVHFATGPNDNIKTRSQQRLLLFFCAFSY